MEKIKIIDLLNKIANKEKVPNEIIYEGKHYYNVGNEEQAYYENSELDDCMLFLAIYNEKGLNDYVEILEEDKKIELLIKKNFTRNQKQIANKINEIIDYLNKENK